MKGNQRKIARERREFLRYKAEKVRVLRELGINCDVEIRRHLAVLENEIQVDNYAHTLILADS